MTQTPQQQAQADQQAAMQTAVVLGTAVTVAEASAALASAYAAAGITAAAGRAALRIAMSFPPDRLGMTGPATRQAIRLNTLRRAQYVVTAGHRISRALLDARAGGTDLLAAMRDAVTAEQRYYGQHMLAIWQRAQAAARVDSAASELGLLLGWYARMDARTSPECRAANGRNFRADMMPLIGWPGAVHPHCRCEPGLPHRGARLIAGTPEPARIRILVGG